MTVGDRLKEQRERARLSQGQVGQYEGVTPQYISDLERGRNNPPAWDLLARLASRYGCTTDYLLGLAEHPKGHAPQKPMPSYGPEVLELLEMIPAERRAEAVALLRNVIEFARVGEHQQALPEPVPARQGGVTKFRRAELGPQQKLNAGDQAAGDDSAHRDTARKDELLALLKKMLSPEDFKYVQRLVDAGLPLTEADINRLLQSGGHQSFEQGFELPDDEGTIS